MNFNSQVIAENASFNAFMNCYLREIDAGEWQRAKSSQATCGSSVIPWFVELALPELHLSVRLLISYKSLVGRHTIHAVQTRAISEAGAWQHADKLYVLIALIQAIYKRKRACLQLSDDASAQLKMQELELLVRLCDSNQLMATFLKQRQGDDNLSKLSFIETEQSALYGHWLHPTPKSRQGMSFWQQNHYSPELCGQFKLHYFSVDKSLVTQGSVLAQSAADIFLSEIQSHSELHIASDHVVIAQHPLQAQLLLLNSEVQKLVADGFICDLGPLGEEFTPTSSVRTLYSEKSPWMYKFSIPVKITNSLRSNKRDELQDGMEVEKYLKNVGFLDSRPQFKMVADPAYMTVNLPSSPDAESGFEVVVRRNLVFGSANNKISSILALAQDPVANNNGELQQSLLLNVIAELAKKERRSISAVAEQWFNRYFECAIESLIMLYDRFGIALEAHQQNSLLDLADGYPSTYYYRDNQGFYLSKNYADSLYVIDERLSLSDIYYDDSDIFDAFAYYAFFNQLFAMIHRLGADGLLEERCAIAIVRQRLLALREKMMGSGRGFIDYMLEQEAIACKTNLLARINDIDELHQGMETAVYTRIDNPLVDHLKDEFMSIPTEKNQESYHVA